MTELSAHLVVALAVLTAVAVVGSAVSRLGTARADAVAVVRAVGQLAIVALILTAVLGRVVWSLALAPITLVQPVGVLAVPVTVVVSAIARRRRPARTQLAGTMLSVAGVAALTVALLLPATQPATLPAWRTLANGVGAVLVGGAAVLVAAVGVVLLARDYPVEAPPRLLEVRGRAEQGAPLPPF